MMFPDTSNEMQRAALRLAAERARSTSSLRISYARPASGDMDFMRQRFPALGAQPPRTANQPTHESSAAA
jgi:hypothetical protein